MLTCMQSTAKIALLKLMAFDFDNFRLLTRVCIWCRHRTSEFKNHFEIDFTFPFIKYICRKLHSLIHLFG